MKVEVAMDDWVTRGVQMIRDAERILVFTGAGLSTESGIPDFRSPGGIWDKYDPSDFYLDRILASQETQARYWKMSSEFYEMMKPAQPNRAHLAVKTLEDAGKLLAIVTQNIDHLHHKAGNKPEKIIEIHGTAFAVSCLTCGKRYERDEIEARLGSGVEIPHCDACSGFLKPATISFGQAMPQEEMERAVHCARECDLCLVLGSSLVVYPAASIPLMALEAGAPMMIINRDPTPFDGQAALVIHASVSVLADMVDGAVR
jgi:NAD-dependent deacetylase